MKIHIKINPHRLSNTYVLELEDNRLVLVDVGNFDQTIFKEWVQVHDKKISHVFLTHEHADHCCGVDALFAFQEFEIICSAECATNMKNSKQNFSYYLEDLEEFEVKTDTIAIVEDGEVLEIGQYKFKILKTPGHSPGSISISVDNHFFSGDTVLNGINTPLTFPHSNRKDYKKSMEKIEQELQYGMQIHPGHDESFMYHSQKQLIYKK